MVKKKYNRSYLILVVALLVLAFALGYAGGYSKGVYQGVSWTIDIGLKFLDSKDIHLDIDAESLKAGVLNYQNQINNCFYQPKLPSY